MGAWRKFVCRLVFVTVCQFLLPLGFGYPGLQTAWADTPPADPNDPAYLRPTPDANSADSHIIQKAADLNHDPAQIFAFVRDQMGNDVYKGSLRGARGTLWSKAGNSLDKASLLVALLRASGIPARYAHGRLTDDQAKPLILSMFQTPLSVVGCPPADALLAEPDKSNELLAEAKEHYWVEFYGGGSFQAADPNFPENAMGQSVTGAADIFTEVPDTLRHKVTLRLKRELTSELANRLFPGNGQDGKVVLSQTFTTAELVGKPLSVGHFVNSSSFGALFVSVTTHTYSPYLLIGQGDDTIANDEMLRGEDYQEQFSNFPLSNNLLTGLFLEMEVIDPTGRSQIYERTLADRIGFAARQNGGSGNVSVAPDSAPLISELDIVTANILPGLAKASAIIPQQERMAKVQQELDGLLPQLNAIPATGPVTEQQRTLQAKAMRLSSQIAVVVNETLGMTFSIASDESLRRLSKGYRVKGYYDSPRIILSLSARDGNSVKSMLDLRKNDLRAVPFPGQVANTGVFFEMMRGIIESSLEGKVVAAVTGQTAVSIGQIFDQLQNGNSLVTLTPASPQTVESLGLSDTAKSRIALALAAGNTVVTPQQMVTINGKQTVAWLEIDWKTGHAISVMEDGGHQAFAEYAAATALIAGPWNASMSAWIGTVHGWAITQYAFMGALIQGIANSVEEGTSVEEVLKEAKEEVAKKILPKFVEAVIGIALPAEAIGEAGAEAAKCIAGGSIEVLVGEIKTGEEKFTKITTCLLSVGTKIIGIPDPVDAGLGDAYKAGVVIGMGLGLGFLEYNVPGDPPVFPFLSSPLAAGPAPVAPGAQAGVAAQIVPDALFYLPFNGVRLPSVFKAQIRNTGPAKDSFNVAFTGVPPGFSAQSSLSAVSIPPGQTAEVGICLNPTSGTLSPPGTSVPFSLRASSATNPGVQNEATGQVLTPVLHGVNLQLDFTTASTVPGGTLNPTLSVSVLGNVGEQLAMQATVPAGLHLSGLPTNLSLAVGETQTIPLTLTVDPSTPLNQTLDLVLTADVAGAPQPSQRTAVLHVNIRSQQAALIDKALAQAKTGGNTQLPDVMIALRDVFNPLQSSPTDQRLWDRTRLIVANLGKVVANDPLLSPLAYEVANLSNLTRNSDFASVQTLLPSVLNDLAQASALGVVAALSPNASVTQPGSATVANLTLKNRGSRSASIKLSLEGLPANVQAALSSSAIRLDTGATQTIPITLTPASEGRFPFRAVATVDGFDTPVKAFGLLVSATGSVNVMSVTGTPPFIVQNGTTQIQTLIANTAVLPLKAKASVTIHNPDGSVRYQSPAPTAIDIPDGDNSIPYALDSVTATGWPDGVYGLEVNLSDANGHAIAGGQGIGTLSVGTPIKASVLASPVSVPPGDSSVTTSINVTSQTVGGTGIAGLAPTDPAKDRIDWAAASRGASLQVVNPGPASVPAAQLLDETRNLDTGEPFFGPGSPFYIGVNRNGGGYFLLDLAAPHTIDSIEFRLWDGDDRYSQYKVEGSLDNTHFFPIADRTSGEYRGVQRIKLPPTELRYIRITGTFDSHDNTYFYLTDEILAIGDGSGSPVPTQTVTLDAVSNSGGMYQVGQKLNLNAGVYEIKQISGAVSVWADDSQHYGKTWAYTLHTTVGLTAKTYPGTGKALASATQADADAASSGRTFMIYVPVHSDVYFWIYDTYPVDNRGSETFAVRQISGPNDSLPQRVRDAMVRGVLWEQPEVASWQDWAYTPDYRCYGCHIQAQSSTGLEVARQKVPGLPLDDALESRFVEGYRFWQNPETGWMPDGNHVTEGSLWAWAVSRFSGVNFDLLSYRFVQTLDWLLTRQLPDGTWSFDADGRANRIYIDADPNVPNSPNATHTAGNMQALAKALTAMSGKDFIPMAADEAGVTGGLVELQRNAGQTMELGFTPVDNITAVRITVSDTFFGQGVFLVNEVEMFRGANPKTISATSASFETNGFTIDKTIDGIKNDQYNGWDDYPQDSRITPVQGLWAFGSPTSLDRLRITQIWPSAQLKKFKLEVTTDSNPSLTSHFVEVSGLQVGYSSLERRTRYLAALTQAARALSADTWPYTRNIRTAAQTVIGLEAALPYLSGADAVSAQTRIEAAAQFLRGAQRDDGGWQDSSGDLLASSALPSAEALDALLLVARSNTDPVIVAGAEYLLNAQKQDGSWNAPQDVARRLASTTWVEIALPTIFENLSAITVGVDQRIPLDSGVSLAAGSPNPPLDSLASDSAQSTLHWDALLKSSAGQGFAYVANVQAMQPGEVRKISNGTTVNFSSVGGNGTVELPPLFVSAQHILRISPRQQSANAGAAVDYTLTLTNLDGKPNDFSLSVSGLPDGGYQIPATLTLAAGESKTFTMTVQTAVNSLANDVAFSVTAQTAAGVKDVATGVLTVAESAIQPSLASLGTQAVNVGLTPAQADAGQGSHAFYTLRINNVGSSTDTYSVVAGVPNGFSATVSEPSVTVSPGLGNYRDLIVDVVTPVGIASGSYPLTLLVDSVSNADVKGFAYGTITVGGAGVSLSFDPNSANANGSLTLRVTNQGSAMDVFDLSVGGPGALGASLSDSSVALAPGAYQDVTVSLGVPAGLVSGPQPLFGNAVSQSQHTVQATAQATVNIAQSKGMEGLIEPPLAVLEAPGNAHFTLTVRNTGNTEDVYSAVISSASGPVSAQLQGLDGTATQSVPLFRLPGLATASIGLDALLQQYGGGAVTVTVVSQSNAAIQSAPMASLRTSLQKPLANAGSDINVLTQQKATLDGSASRDPQQRLLGFAWHFDQVPAGSLLLDRDIADGDAPKPSFTPDVAGVYRLKLLVNNGLLDSDPAYVNIIAVAAANVPPNAAATTATPNARVNTQVFVDGSASNDPDNGPQPLAYQWAFSERPAGSQASLANANQRQASFTPDLPGDYTLTLRVSDGAATATAPVTVTAAAANLPPNANAGDDQSVFLGATVSLDGTKSNDPDHAPQALAYAWRFVSKPAGSRLGDADIVAENPDGSSPKASFKPDVVGQFLVQLQASDGAPPAATDNATVTVLNPLVYQNVTRLLKISTGNTNSSLDGATRRITSSARVTLANTSAMAISAPVVAVFTANSPQVSMPSAGGTQADGSFFHNLAGALAPNESVTFDVTFSYPETLCATYTRSCFSYTIKIFGRVPTDVPGGPATSPDYAVTYPPPSAAPAPTVALSASPTRVSAKGSSTLSWSSSNASSCNGMISDGWSGAMPLSGSTVVRLVADTTYTLACAGSGGSASKSVTVTVMRDPQACLLDWAEQSYPQLFSPAGAVSQVSPPYTYRYYRNTNAYVGVSSTDNHVYYLGPDGSLQDVGGLPGWLAKAGCQ